MDEIDTGSNNEDLLALKTVDDPDTMYMHQAMKQPDKKEFIKAIQKKVSDQSNNKNVSIMMRKDIPRGKYILPTLWQTCRKRDIKLNAIKK